MMFLIQAAVIMLYAIAAGALLCAAWIQLRMLSAAGLSVNNPWKIFVGLANFTNFLGYQVRSNDSYFSGYCY